VFSAQDQVIIYNETFRYVYDKFGYDALKDLWAKMSREWCVDLDRLTAEKGLDGVREYWCGQTGTLTLEEADYGVAREGNTLYFHMDRCPSLGGELIDRGYKIFPKYCEHCNHLYPPIMKKYGIDCKWHVEFDIDTMLPTSKCRWFVTKLE